MLLSDAQRSALLHLVVQGELRLLTGGSWGRVPLRGPCYDSEVIDSLILGELAVLRGPDFRRVTPAARCGSLADRLALEVAS